MATPTSSQHDPRTAIFTAQTKLGSAWLCEPVSSEHMHALADMLLAANPVLDLPTALEMAAKLSGLPSAEAWGNFLKPMAPPEDAIALPDNLVLVFTEGFSQLLICASEDDPDLSGFPLINEISSSVSPLHVIFDDDNNHGDVPMHAYDDVTSLDDLDIIRQLSHDYQVTAAMIEAPNLQEYGVTTSMTLGGIQSTLAMLGFLPEAGGYATPEASLSPPSVEDTQCDGVEMTYVALTKKPE